MKAYRMSRPPGTGLGRPALISTLWPAHLDEHLYACDTLEGQQQEGVEGQALAQRRPLQSSHHRHKLRIRLPVGRIQRHSAINSSIYDQLQIPATRCFNIA